jgi:hypothetical protein
MKTWKKVFNTLLATALFLGVNLQLATGQIERNKTIKKDFSGKSVVLVSHQYGPLTIKKSTDGKVHLEAVLVAKSNDEESVQALFDHFDVNVLDGNDNLDLATKLDIESWNTINGKTTIKFRDGKKVSGLREAKANLTLHVPDLQRLTLENKYDEIQIEPELTGSTIVKLYSGELTTNNLKGEFQLDIKYGKARLKNLGRAVMTLYDSNVSAADAEDLVASSKYSEVEMGNIARKLVLDTYDDTWKTGNIGGQLSLIDKYSEFKIAALADLNISESYDDQFTVQEIGSLSATGSKYTEYHFERLTKKMSITESFDDKIRANEVSGDFSSVSLNGKYTEVTLDFAENARYALTVDLTYGKLDYPKNKVDVKILKEKDSKKYLSGMVGGGSDKMVNISGYDHEVTIR